MRLRLCLPSFSRCAIFSHEHERQQPYVAAAIACAAVAQDLGDFTQNRITSLPADVVQLQDLQLLRCGTNKLSVLPDGLSQLRKMHTLDVSNNDLTTVPAELGLLEDSLKALHLEGNMLKTMRQALLSQGTIAVLRYLKSRLPPS